MHSKTILLLILSLFAFSFAQSSVFRDATCRPRSCAKNLEVCGSNVTSSSAIIGCRSDSDCSATSSTVNGICIPPSRLGEPCVAQQTCEAGTTCVGGYCSLNAPASRYRYPGEKCANNMECIFNDPIGLDQENLCREGRCRYVADGQYCTDDANAMNQCRFDKSYCGRSRRCEKLIKKGGACNFGDNTENGCGRKNMCVRNGPDDQAGTCQERYSVKEGGYCYTDRSDYCDEGLYCKLNKETNDRVCTKVNKSPTLGKPCFTFTSNFSNTCDSDNNEACGCVEGSDVTVCYANVLQKKQFNAQWDVQECQRKHCPSRTFQCYRDKCSDQSCKVYKMDRKRSSLSCRGETYCNSAFSLSPLSSIVALVAVVAVFML